MMKYECKAVGSSELAALFPKISERANKGDMGRLLVVCGSYDKSGLSMCGAAYFAAKAAYRCGAGIVEIFTPRENYAALAALVPEAVFSLYGYDESPDCVSERLKESIAKSDAAVIGCGLGKSEMSRTLLKATLECASHPLLIDADGLNIISEDKCLLDSMSKEQRSRTVITPHPGEMSRLCEKNVAEIMADTVKLSCDFSSEKTGLSGKNL